MKYLFFLGRLLLSHFLLHHVFSDSYTVNCICDTFNSCDLKGKAANNHTVLKHMTVLENNKTSIPFSYLAIKSEAITFGETEAQVQRSYKVSKQTDLTFFIK